MSIVTSLLGSLFKDIQSTLISLLIGLITIALIYVGKFYYKVSKYPKGPFPNPFSGNLGLFKNRITHEVIIELIGKYGGVFTIWMAQKPIVILGSHETITEGLITKKNDLAGRPKFFFETLISPNSSDVLSEDWGRPWEVLRRVAHTAARKFAVSPKLPKLEVGVVDEVVDLILEKEGINHPFNPKDYIYLMVYSTLASIAAGKSYSITDQEFLDLKNATDVADETLSNLLLIESIPILRFVYWRQWQKLINSRTVVNNWIRTQMDEHLTKFDAKNNEVEIKDFCDALISARIEAQETDSQASPYLTKDNLMNVLMNLFEAGTQTTRETLDWTFLLLANYQDAQRKLRTEIEEIIGDEIPTNEHKNNCHYVQSFIAEVLRFSPIASVGAPHRAIVDTEVNGHKIPKDTVVSVMHIVELHSDEIWGDARVFRPERFIDPATGAFNARMNDAFHPFSIGRRACLGERLALMNLFVQITRFLQKTKGMKIVLKNGTGSVSLEPDPEQPTMYVCVPHEIMIVRDD